MIAFIIYPDGSVDILQNGAQLCTLTSDEAKELVQDRVLQRGLRQLVALVVAYLTGRKTI